MSKKISINDCKEMSKKYDFQKILIIGINESEAEIDLAIATYGKTKEHCKDVGNLGQKYLSETILKCKVI